MLNIIPSQNRYFSDMGNMNSYFLFSFADYYDPQNQSFGKLRVFNDDSLEGNSGFGMHPHKYYEIMSIMLDGTITHKDSLGNDMKISKNQIQVTNTSTGISHSEINEEKESLKLYQIWFSPDEINQEPIYYTASFEEKDFENNLEVLASGIDENSENKLKSKVSVKRGIFDEKQVLDLNYDKYLFLYIKSGKVRINDEIILNLKDQLRAFEEKSVKLEFLEKTDFILIESE